MGTKRRRHRIIGEGVFQFRAVSPFRLFARRDIDPAGLAAPMVEHISIVAGLWGWKTSAGPGVGDVCIRDPTGLFPPANACAKLALVPPVLHHLGSFAGRARQGTGPASHGKDASAARGTDGRVFPGPTQTRCEVRVGTLKIESPMAQWGWMRNQVGEAAPAGF